MATVIQTMKIKTSELCDFHAHILPSADHGSTSCEISRRQLELARACGVSRVVATPHFYPQKMNVSDFIKKRDDAYNTLEPFIPAGMSVVPGAEVLLCENMEKLPDLKKLCVGNSDIMLLELPYTDLGPSFLYTALAIMDQGVRVVLAHAERYEFSYVNEFVSYGAKIQINSGSLSKLLGVSKEIINWFESEAVVAIGTDIHGPDKNAYKSFLRAQNKIKRYLPFVEKSSNAMWNDMTLSKVPNMTP